jgi:hypothetical protein
MIASSHTSLTLSTTHLQFSLQRPGMATTGFGHLKYRGVYYSTHGGFDKRSSATFFLARLLVSLQTYFDGLPIASWRLVEVHVIDRIHKVTLLQPCLARLVFNCRM